MGFCLRYWSAHESICKDKKKNSEGCLVVGECLTVAGLDCTDATCQCPLPK